MSEFLLPRAESARTVNCFLAASVLFFSSFVATANSYSAPQNQALRTAACRLNVNQAGQVADQEALKDFYYFVDAGGPGFLFDGSLILGNSATNISWRIFEGSGGVPTGSNPFTFMQELTPTTGMDSTSFTAYRLATGEGTNGDGSLKFRVRYYAPKHPDSSQFFVARFDVTKGPTNPTGTITNLTVGFADDWNIPSDIATMNTSGFDPVKSLLYQQSTGSSTNRTGAVKVYRDDSAPIVGEFAWDNAVHVDPQNTFENDDLWSAMEALSQDQYTPAVGTGDFSTVTVIGRDLSINGAVADTFSFNILFLTGRNSGLGELQAVHDKALHWMCAHVSNKHSECICVAHGRGDANNDNSLTISDAFYIKNFLCAAGPAPTPLFTGDADADCDIDTCDFQYMVDYFFAAGPPPPNTCDCLSPTVIGCTCGNGFCTNSTTDPVLLICPGGDEPFHVYLEDADGDPVVNDSSVYLVFNDCSGIIQCPPGGPLTTVYPNAPSDANGVLTFYVAGGGCNTACSVDVMAPCGLIATVPVRTFDINGDLGVSLSFDFDFSECNNYDGLPGIQFVDQSKFFDHVTHHCGLDPCERFQAEFYLEPDYDLVPGQVVNLKLVLKNNNFDACQIGFIGFFSSGFGSGGGTTLIQNYNYNQSLPPGAEDTVTIPYTVPGIGHGCLDVQFVTSCCNTAVHLTQCAQSNWHCAADAGICYDVIIRLTGEDVTNIEFFESFPAPGWFVDPVHIPATPVTVDDSIWYRICTPEDGMLGDEAHVTVALEYASGPPDFFENKVFITPRTGDCNGDCLINISDAVYLINYIFAGGPPPLPCQAGDVDCTGIVTISDVVHIINFIFAGGPSPCLPDGSVPLPTCGMK